MRRFAIVPLLAVLAVAVLAACEPATTELTEEQKAAIADELSASKDANLAAIRDLDADRLLAFYENSEDFTWTLYGSVNRGWSTWAEHVRSAFSGMASVESCEISDDYLQILASDIAVGTGLITMTGTTTAGDSFLIEHTYTTVSVKWDGQWKKINISETYQPSTPEG